MKHIPTIASRELRSLFVSPVAYAVLTLFVLLAGFFFLSSLLQFEEYSRLKGKISKVGGRFTA
jgi:ABC-type transport system involved in multi-copper enzyme maturation permease subunit